MAPGQVPGDVAAALTLLDAGETSTALTRGGWRVFLMLCSRGAAPEDMPSRDEIRLQLTNQQLAAKAEIFLEELRSEAIIIDP
jgi:peptidyl-prolyl cis-trans isomerase SurA